MAKRARGCWERLGRLWESGTGLYKPLAVGIDSMI